MGAVKKVVSTNSSLIEGLDWSHARVNLEYILDADIVDLLTDDEYKSLKDSIEAVVKLQHEYLIKFLIFKKKYPKVEGGE